MESAAERFRALSMLSELCQAPSDLLEPGKDMSPELNGALGILMRGVDRALQAGNSRGAVEQELEDHLPRSLYRWALQVMYLSALQGLCEAATDPVEQSDAGRQQKRLTAKKLLEGIDRALQAGAPRQKVEAALRCHLLLSPDLLEHMLKAIASGYDD